MAAEWDSGSDELSTTLTTHVDNRSYHIWTYRQGDGGSGSGRPWEKSDATDDSLFNTANFGGAYLYRRDFDGGGNGEWTIASPALNEWHPVGVSYNDTATTNDPIMYLDGASQTVTERITPVGSAVDNATAYSIGNRIGATDASWDGYLAEFGIWDRILTAAEFAALGKGFSPLFFPNDLVLYYPLVRNLTLDVVGGAGTVANVTVVPHPRIIYPSISQIRRFTTTVAPGGTTWPGYQAPFGWQ